MFHHLVGGRMFIIKFETVETAMETLEMDDVRHMLDEAVSTGDHVMSNMLLSTAIGTELGSI